MSQPFYVRTLTRAERAAIRTMRKRPPGHAVYLRAQAVHFSSQRLTAEAIAAILERDRTTVFRWLQAFDARGLEALWPGKSPGRPPTADANVQAALAQAVERNPRDLGIPSPDGPRTCWPSTCGGRRTC